MTRITLTLAASLLAGTALAQTTGSTAGSTTPGSMAPGATSNAPMPGVSPSTGVTPGTGMVGRNSGTAAASGDRNPAVATTSANAPQPARGANSFSQGEAQRRIAARGFQGVSALQKDAGGVWRGTATKDGQSVGVWLDYKGNVGQDGGMAQVMSAPGSAPGGVVGAHPTGINPAGSSAAAPR